MIKKVEMSEYERVKVRNTSIYSDVDEFLASGEPVCEVVTDEYKSPQIAYNCYRAGVKRMNNGVTVTKAGNRVFLLAPNA